MTAIGALLEHPYAQALSWALVHFVWQGAAVGLVAWLIWRFAGWSSRARYATGVIAMALMLIAPIATTMVVLGSDRSPASVASGPAVAPVTNMTAVTAARPAARVPPVEPVEPAEPVEPLILAVWLSGVLVLMARLFGGWIVARRFTTTGVAPVTAEIEVLAQRLAREIGLVRLVRLFESTRVAVPVTIGWIKPVVLLPVTALSGLSASQIEALLAHELAHVRRHDYLVNLLQSAVETLLFYHPAVWWVSARVRAEREDCCDDLAVRVCDRLVYVRALTDLASLTTPRLALAATDGSLVHRVRRILGEPGRDGATGSGWLSALLALAIVGGAAPVIVSSMSRISGETTPGQVSGGVAGGVPGRVVGGVTAGVPGGVVGGVAGGVPGGVPGGVSGGVPGGVASGPGEDAEEAQAADPALQSTIRRLREAQEMEQEVARRIREAHQSIELERLTLEVRRLQTEHVSERQLLVEQIEGKRREMDALKGRVQSGAANPDDLAKLETELRLLEVKRSTIDQTLQLAVRDVELKRRQAEQLNDLARRQEEVASVRRSMSADAQEGIVNVSRDYETAKQRYAEHLAEKEKRQAAGLESSQAWVAKAEQLRLTLAQRETELAGLRAMLQSDRSTVSRESAMVSNERRLAEDVRRLVDEADRRARADVVERPLEQTAAELRALMRAREARMAETAIPLAATDITRAGDIVRIEIHNEPELPNTFVVQSDGTIRLPLIGNVKVAGLNPRQVQDAITTQFSDRRLESAANVAVSVRRPRAGRDETGR